MLTEKLLQTTQKIKILGSESRVNKKWQTVAIIREILYSNLETGRYGWEPGSPRLCGRVDSTEVLPYYNNYYQLSEQIQYININSYFENNLKRPT